MSFRAMGFLLLPVAALYSLVLLVIAGGAEKEMVWIYAGGIVAAVENLQASRNGAINQRPSNAMCAAWFAINR